jgi:hypothetical protein
MLCHHKLISDCMWSVESFKLLGGLGLRRYDRLSVDGHLSSCPLFVEPRAIGVEFVWYVIVIPRDYQETSFYSHLSYCYSITMHKCWVGLIIFFPFQLLLLNLSHYTDLLVSIYLRGIWVLWQFDARVSCCAIFIYWYVSSLEAKMLKSGLQWWEIFYKNWKIFLFMISCTSV